MPPARIPELLDNSFRRITVKQAAVVGTALMSPAVAPHNVFADASNNDGRRLGISSPGSLTPGHCCST